jgi:hypothetical protein
MPRPPIKPSGGGGIYQLVSPEAAQRAQRLAAGQPTAPPHDLGGGIPGITPFARQWANAAVGVPAGLGAIGKAYGQDLGTLVSNARTGKRMSGGAAMQHSHMLALIRGIAGQTAQDFEHPWRNRGYLLFDLMAKGMNAEGSATRFAAAEHAANEAATPLAKLPAAVPKPRLLPPISPRVVSPSTVAAAKDLMVGRSGRTPRQRVMRDAAYTSRDAIQANRAPIPPVQTRAAQAQLPRAQGAGGQVQPPAGASALARLLAGRARAQP